MNMVQNERKNNTNDVFQLWTILSLSDFIYQMKMENKKQIREPM